MKEALLSVLALINMAIENIDSIYSSDTIDLEFLDGRKWECVQEVDSVTWRTFYPSDEGDVTVTYYRNEEATDSLLIPYEDLYQVSNMLRHNDYYPE